MENEENLQNEGPLVIKDNNKYDIDNSSSDSSSDSDSSKEGDGNHSEEEDEVIKAARNVVDQ
jgi:hypothetical protein